MERRVVMPKLWVGHPVGHVRCATRPGTLSPPGRPLATRLAGRPHDPNHSETMAQAAESPVRAPVGCCGQPVDVSAQAEKGQDEKHDNDQADDVNDAVHGIFLRVNGMNGGASPGRR